MIEFKNISLRTALVISAVFLSKALFSQAFLELLPGSKELTYDESIGAHKLLGGANFIYQNNTMYCDSAYFFDKTNQMKAYGHVHVNKSEQLNLFCDSLNYNAKTSWATLYGNVRVIDDTYKLTTDSMDFNTKSQYGVYKNGGTISHLTENEVLKSRVGYMYPNSKDFFFRGKVEYLTPRIKMYTDTLKYTYSENKCYFFGPTDILADSTKMYCEKGWYNVKTEEGSLQQNASILKDAQYFSGDTLLYSPILGKSEGIGNVFFKDTTDQIAFSGNYALFNEKENYSFLTGDALGMRFQDKDTVYFHADTLFNQNDSSGNRIATYGYYNVKILSKDFQGKADSLSFVKEKEEIELFRDPIVWSKNSELKGEFISIALTDSTIKQVNIIDKSTVIMEVDSGMYYNQIGGKVIHALFKDKELHLVKTIGNAQTIYFPVDEEKTDTLVTYKRIGMNTLAASELSVYLDSGEVIGVTYFQEPEGVFYPMKKVVEKDKYITNFSNRMILRPKSLEDLKD